MVDVAIHDKEERIAAGMRQVALAGTRPNQKHADLNRESRLRYTGESAVSTAKKIGKSRQDVDAIRAIQKFGLRERRRAIFKDQLLRVRSFGAM